MSTTTTLSSLNRFRGCLLGGAVGDALGAGIEFDSLASIRHRYGPAGVTGYTVAYGRSGTITDDTQMTLFTAEGLIRAQQRMRDRGICNVAMVVWRAYQRWLLTQDSDERRVPWDPEFPPGPSGWLVNEQVLRTRRAPGNTCLAALETGTPGSVQRPLNNSKGCGGVMRVAPVGLIAADPFDLGCDVAALTHGHPSGYLAAGALAAVIAQLAAGATVSDAIAGARESLDGQPEAGEVSEALDSATRLATSGRAAEDSIRMLGQGWVAEEALAIACYCALTAASFRDGVLAAVNHDGDSDSTGAICGNILGTALGVEAIDAALLDGLEGRHVVEDVARDLHGAFLSGEGIDFGRYPPW